MPPTRPAAPRRPAPPRPAAALATARLVILAVVLGFGATAWLRHRDGVVPVDPAVASALLWAVGGAWLAGVGGVLVLRRAWARAQGAMQRHRLTVIAWALAEIPALAGGIHFWRTGDPRLYSAGLFFLLLSFFLFSTPASRR